jgi:tetratricopeptide (TPR) repeat protein
MSILDDLPDKDAIEAAERMVKPILQVALDRLDLTPRQRHVVECVRKGIPLAGALGITRVERDAMLLRAGQLLSAGRFADARGVLFILLTLQPTDPRVVFTLAAACQLQGDIPAAGRLFLFYISLRATDPQGYLRLVECLMGARDYEEAAQFARAAERLCASGYGSEETACEARRLSEAIAEARSRAAN